jgi:hypothetical protein
MGREAVAVEYPLALPLATPLRRAAPSGWSAKVRP